MRDIRILMEQLKEMLTAIDFNGYKIVPLDYLDKKKELRPYYEVNESFFMMLVMGYNTKKALIIKNEFIKQFMSMKHELIMRSNTRHIGINVRKDLTKMISNNIIDYQGNFKKFAISNYTRMIYKKVLGKNVKKWKIENNYPADCKARDYMNQEQINKVQEIESKIADIIEFNNSDDPKELYAKIRDFIK